MVDGLLPGAAVVAVVFAGMIVPMQCLGVRGVLVLVWIPPSEMQVY